MSVLVLADDVDATADAVVRALQARQIEVNRVNTAWFPTRLSMSARLHQGRWTGVITTPGQEVELEAVTAIWYRTPTAFEFPLDLSSPERAHANLEAKYGLGGVTSSLPVLWVNHPMRLADAAYKPVQLAVAHDCGLRVADTLVSNDPEDIRRFARGGPTVNKVLGSNTLVEESLRKLTFTRLLDDSDVADLRGIETTTHLFQRWVPKAYDVRLVVIGARLTAAAITAHSAAGAVDFRSDYANLSYELTDPPAEVAAGVRRLMDRMGLMYAALDFVVDPDGGWTFLEINAGGQFGWIEARTGAQLTDQLADLLSKGES